MSNLHPATAPHIRRAIARRQRRDQFARVVLFGGSFIVCFLSTFPLAAIAKDHSSEQQRALAAAGLMGAVAMAGASLVCAAGAATEA